MAALTLDLIVPTYNRASLLRALLASIASTPIPPDMTVAITVVDNHSRDDTRDVVHEAARRFSGRVRYLLETRPGKSAALNAGIGETSGDVIAFLDDDEVISPEWFRCLARMFRDEQIDFVSGRCLPRWETTPPPQWLPAAYPAVIGAIDGGTNVLEFRRDYDGTMSGGNSAIRRAVLARVGLFSTRLGPRADTRLLCCEDEDIYLRLIDAGARGVYVPELLVYHHVHPDRLTRRYHRRWCFWRGVSKAFLHEGRRQDLPHVGSIPRFLYGAALRGVLRMVRPSIGGASASAARFNGELAVWDLAGFIYGRYVFRPCELEPARLAADGAAKEPPPCSVAAIG